MFQILIMENDKNTRRLVEAVLKEYGCHPTLACDGLGTLELLDTHHVDLVIPDIMMPGVGGYEFIRQLKATDYTLPTLVITTKQLPEDKRKGFIIGTSDYMTEPVDEEEVILHIRALLRGTQIVSEWRITTADVCLGYDLLTISRGDESQTLPHREFYSLYKLLSYPSKIFTRIQLANEIWGMESQSDDNTINIYINRLRKRFEDYSEFTIETIRSLGYKAVKHL